MKQIISVTILATLFACNNAKVEDKAKTTIMPKLNDNIGKFETFDSAFNSIVNKSATATIIADGFEWSEGSLWVAKHNMLLFSDVPTNTVYKWTAEKGKEIYLKPSGYTGATPSLSKEPGANGLTLDNEGNLVLCQHGDRRVAKMDATLNKPLAKYITLAEKYDGKKFSSPNDVVCNKAGEFFFTDPPYGLPNQAEDPTKETSWNGVYKVKKDGTVILLVDSITRPNGLAFFPDEKRLLIASSDPQNPNWYVFDVNGDKLENGKIFYSAIEERKTMKQGLPDGLRIDSKGNVYATGPGGVYFFNSQGKKIGMLHLENATSNCALSPDEKTLYVTNDMYVLKVKLRD